MWMVGQGDLGMLCQNTSRSSADREENSHGCLKTWPLEQAKGST